MPRIGRHLTYANVVATLCLVAVVAGGSAFALDGAQTAATATTIKACVKKFGGNRGAIRIGSRCTSKERRLVWNRRGRAGATGVAGAPGAAGADAVAPAGAVGFFALASCPSGWAPYAEAQGRYVVGLPANGTLGGTAGTALGDKEDRPVGKHTHAVIDPGHTHDIEVDPILNGGNVAAQRVTGTADTQTGFVQQMVEDKALTATTGITLADAGSVAGTNAPYVQLLACKKG